MPDSNPLSSLMTLKPIFSHPSGKMTGFQVSEAHVHVSFSVKEICSLNVARRQHTSIDKLLSII